MKKKSVYVETTIPSYVTARPSSDSIKLLRQIITQTFWENERHKYDLYISQYVVEECEKGDKEAAKRRVDLIKDIRFLPVTKEMEELAEKYFEFLKIPFRAKTDCFHLAISVIERMNYLMSWNMTHLGERYFNEIAEFNYKNNLWLPKMHTPDAIMDIEKEEEQNGGI
jgi:hypothetical protein